MDKIIDFKYVSKYFCTQCNSFHKKSNKNLFHKHKPDNTDDSIIRYYCEICNCYHKKPLFELHQQTGFQLTLSELWNLQFSKSWKRYDLFKEIGK